jgi:hypothetical protein
MIGATNPWFFSYVARVITFAKTRPIPPLEMGKEAHQQTRGASKHSKELGPKSFPNSQMKVELQEVN